MMAALTLAAVLQAAPATVELDRRLSKVEGMLEERAKAFEKIDVKIDRLADTFEELRAELVKARHEPPPPATDPITELVRWALAALGVGGVFSARQSYKVAREVHALREGEIVE